MQVNHAASDSSRPLRIGPWTAMGYLPMQPSDEAGLQLVFIKIAYERTPGVASVMSEIHYYI